MLSKITFNHCWKLLISELAYRLSTAVAVYLLWRQLRVWWYIHRLILLHTKLLDLEVLVYLSLLFCVFIFTRDMFLVTSKAFYWSLHFNKLLCGFKLANSSYHTWFFLTSQRYKRSLRVKNLVPKNILVDLTTDYLICYYSSIISAMTAYSFSTESNTSRTLYWSLITFRVE